MKLATAEVWKDQFHKQTHFTATEDQIRQIQADALRFAAHQFHQAISECTAISNVPQRIDLEIEHFENLANQLHPLPEFKSKRVTLADAERIAKECTGSDSLETISCCQCGQPPAFPTLAKEPWTCISCQNKS